VGYILENKPIYLLRLVVIWFGNLAGASAVGYTLRLTRQSVIAKHAAQIAEVKLHDTLLSVFILAVFCNILMYIAVDGFRMNRHELGKYIGIILAVEVFILCGFEHCVANMFYFSIANVWSLKTFLYLLTATAGNMVGGILIPLSRTLVKYEKAETRRN
jgi:formate/nitrite transporter FocA (FNT family)